MAKKPVAPRRQGIASQRIEITKLRGDDDNPNIHDEKNLDAITASLQRFGQVEPLVVQKKTMHVIGGNGRLEAMQRLGWKEAAIWLVDVDDNEARALGIALNRTNRLSRFDNRALMEQLQEIQGSDRDLLAATGFSQEDLDDLVATLEPVPDVDNEEPGGDAKLTVTCPKCRHEFKVGA